MKQLFKTISRYTGNLCFAGSTDFGDYLFEVSRKDRTIQYVKLPDGVLIQGLCYEKFAGGYDCYLVNTNTEYISQYSNNSLNGTYVYVGSTAVCDICGALDTGFAYFDFSSNQIVKYEKDFSGVNFSFAAPPPLNENIGLFIRESNKNIIYNNGEFVYIIKDNGSWANILFKRSIPGTGEIKITMGDKYMPQFSYARYRQVTDEDMDCSSSSSSSSSSSTSSTSSSESSSDSVGNFTTSSSSTSSEESIGNVSSESSQLCAHLQITMTISAVQTTEDFYRTETLAYDGSPGYETIGATKTLWLNDTQWLMLDAGFNPIFYTDPLVIFGAENELAGTEADWEGITLGDTIDSIACMD